MRTAAANLVLLAGAAGALACPVCASAAGDAVRAGLFDGEFARNLAAMLLPFAVTAGVVAFVSWGGGRR